MPSSRSALLSGAFSPSPIPARSAIHRTQTVTPAAPCTSARSTARAHHLIPVVVVLDHGGVGRVGPRGDRLAAPRCEHDATGRLMRGGEQHAAGAAAGQRLRVESMLVDGDRYRVQAPALGGAAVVGVSGVLECDCADALLREY